MNSFMRFKKWLTLAEAARTLTGFFESTVSEADVLRLALDRQISLSAVFIRGPVYAAEWVPVQKADIEYEDVPAIGGNGTVPYPTRGPVVKMEDLTWIQKLDWTADRLLQLDDDSPFELAMIGGEVGDVQQQYWKLLNVPREPTTSLDGVFLRSGTGKSRKILGLLTEFRTSHGRDYFDAGNLPAGTVLVITPAALEAFLRSAKSEDVSAVGRASAPRWPWGSHETENLRHLAAAAAEWWSHYDPAKPLTAPKNEVVSSWLQERGVPLAMADKMATILRADGLRPGPRK